MLNLALGLHITGRGAGGGGSTQQTHVFIVAGQSNSGDMAVWDNGAEYPAGTMQYTQAGALEEITTRHLDHPTATVGRFGWALQFVIDYKAANPDVRVVLIPQSVNASSFALDAWGVGNPQSNNTINRANTLMAANPNFQFKGILWHQGESDGIENNPTYQTELDAQLNAFRSDITAADANTPIVLGNLARDWVGTNADYLAIDGVITKTLQRLQNVQVAPSSRLDVSDGIHFDAAAMRAMGSRYYDAYARIPAVAVTPTDLNTMPPSVTRAILPDHMVFNGSNQLTGFTNDLLGNSTNSTVVGAPARGANGGYLMRESTGASNYVRSVWPELNVASPSGVHVAICFRRTQSDTAGLLIGTSNDLAFLGSAVSGDSSLSTIFGSTSNLRDYHFEFDGGDFQIPNGTGSTTRNTLFAGFYNDGNIRSVAFEDISNRQSGGECLWGRYGGSANSTMEAEILGFAVCTDYVYVEQMYQWLTWRCTA